MSKKRFWIVTGILVIIAVIIRIYSSNQARVEGSYSNGFYPYISSFFRIIFGWLPFSIGDILYGLAVIWLVWKVFRGIKALIKKKVTKLSFLDGLKKATIIILSIYIIFNLFWGINYNRKGIVSQLELKQDSISFQELKEVTMMVVEKMNATKKYLLQNKIAYPSNTELFKKVEAAYDKTEKKYPFLGYHHVSIKPSIWGWIGNYTGFTGYYNPFTGEAQVNTYVPDFLRPFVACHEIGHQLGYAKEDEASAVGYLAALHSGDSLLLYSAYFDLYNSARRELLYQSFLHNDTASLKKSLQY